MDDEENISNVKIEKHFVILCSAFENICDIKTALDNFRRLQLLDIKTSTDQNVETSIGIKLNTLQTEELYFSAFGVKFIQLCVKDKANI